MSLSAVCTARRVEKCSEINSTELSQTKLIIEIHFMLLPTRIITALRTYSEESKVSGVN